MTDVELVVCANCGRAYGRSRGSDFPPFPASEAATAAKLTGWTRSDDGKWFCGLD